MNSTQSEMVSTAQFPLFFKMHFLLTAVLHIIMVRKLIVKGLDDSCLVIQIHTMPQFNEVSTARGNSYSQHIKTNMINCSLEDHSSDYKQILGA